MHAFPSQQLLPSDPVECELKGNTSSPSVTKRMETPFVENSNWATVDIGSYKDFDSSDRIIGEAN